MSFQHVPADYQIEFDASGDTPQVFVDGYMSSFGYAYNLRISPSSGSAAYVSLASTAVIENTILASWNIYEDQSSSTLNITTAEGSVIRNFAGGDGGAIHAEGALKLQNHGVIDAQRAGIGTGPWAVQGMHGGELQNYGTIHGEIDFNGAYSATVTNYGQIVNEYDSNDAFEGSDTGDLFFNRGNGTVVGAISLNGGDDTYATDKAVEGYVYGGSGDDIFTGGIGRDYFSGGADDDTYVLGDDTTDTIDEFTGQGTDTIWTSVSRSLVSYPNIENLRLTGSSNLLGTGSAVANVLDATSNSGTATLRGLGGDDTYNVAANSIVDESAKGSGGIDTVVSQQGFNLSDTRHVKGSVENLTVEGGGIGTGNGLANIMNGSVTGSSETLRGLAGNDTYLVDAQDVVDESAKGSGGTDTVRASFNVDLRDTAHFKGSIENVVLFGVGATTATGNALANTLDGHQTMAHNHLVGGAGNDTYIIDAFDMVDETDGSGTDTIKADTSVDLTNSLQVKGTIEKVVLMGGAADTFDFIGDSHNTIITGNAASNSLFGGGGADTFVFNTLPSDPGHADSISDFAHGTDKIGLDNSVYNALGTHWTAGQFIARANDHKAQTSGQHIIYDKADSTLWYDSDGKGGHAAVEFAILQNHPATITAADFVIV